MKYTFPIDHEIESSATSLHTKPIRQQHNAELAHTQQHTEMHPSANKKNLIKKLPNNKANEPNKISTTSPKTLPTKPIIQLYYIFKTYLKLCYFPMATKTAKCQSRSKKNPPQMSPATSRSAS